MYFPVVFARPDPREVDPLNGFFLFKNEVQLGGPDVAGNGRAPVG
jgi:hypothetical protein